MVQILCTFQTNIIVKINETKSSSFKLMLTAGLSFQVVFARRQFEVDFDLLALKSFGISIHHLTISKARKNTIFPLLSTHRYVEPGFIFMLIITYR